MTSNVSHILFATYLLPVKMSTATSPETEGRTAAGQGQVLVSSMRSAPVLILTHT